MTDKDIEISLKYVEDTFKEVPPAPDKESDELAEVLSDFMEGSDLRAWAGHLLTTPLGLLALARIKLGFGAPATGVQWLGMAAFVASCKILIYRGYPPAAAKIDGDPHYTLEECGQCKALTLVRSGALLKCNHCGHMQEVST